MRSFLCVFYDGDWLVISYRTDDVNVLFVKPFLCHQPGFKEQLKLLIIYGSGFSHGENFYSIYKLVPISFIIWDTGYDTIGLINNTTAKQNWDNKNTFPLPFRLCRRSNFPPKLFTSTLPCCVFCAPGCWGYRHHLLLKCHWFHSQSCRHR